MTTTSSAHKLCAALRGSWHGTYGMARCPAHDDHTPSLSISETPDDRLLLHCFAGCRFHDILAAAGLAGHLFTPDLERATRNVAREAADRARRIQQAREIWASAGSIQNSLAERYLQQRGIPIPIPPTLRFHADCWHGPTAQKLPAMIGLVSVGKEFVGVHRTFLAEPGTKAFGPESKMMLGRCTGGAVRLSGGSGPIVIAEGIETALSLLSGLPEARVWAALSTSGMAGLTLPSPIGDLVIAPDGDGPGRAAADRLARRAYAAGWRVWIVRCPDACDWNDLVREAAA